MDSDDINPKINEKLKPKTDESDDEQNKLTNENSRTDDIKKDFIESDIESKTDDISNTSNPENVFAKSFETKNLKNVDIEPEIIEMDIINNKMEPIDELSSSSLENVTSFETKNLRNSDLNDSIEDKESQIVEMDKLEEKKIFDKKKDDLVLSRTNQQRITLSFQLSATVDEKKPFKEKISDSIQKIKNKKSSDIINSQKKVTKILNDVRGVVEPGQLCAIMGASGAGKTTLLNLLNFRNSANFNQQGEIKLNGKKATWKSITEHSGYVQQLDLFIGTMTVKEHLTFLAFLKMGRYFTKEEKNDRVKEIITKTNLIKAEDTMIGIGDLSKGISGGEKRRLAFASEIITHKSLLFCDEPTSGLDIYMAMGLVNLMKDLASEGKTIICTIHQPTTQIFNQFDTLCLLSEGRTAYFGPRTEAVGFFSRLEYNCPSTYNPADFFIKTLAILPQTREESLERAGEICDAFDESDLNEKLTEKLREINLKSSSLESSVKTDQHKYASTLASQLKWMVWRNLLNDKRQPVTKILVAQVLFIAIFFGLIYLRLDNDEVGAGNRNGLLFLILMNGAFMFLFPIIVAFTMEMPIFYRENKNKLYSPTAYYLMKQLVEFPKINALSIIYCTIVYWMAGIRDDFVTYILVAVIINLSTQCSVSFAYMIAALTASTDVSLAIAAPILIPLVMFAGFFNSTSTIPVYFIWCKYISWFYYAFDAIMIVLWSDYGSIDCSKSPPVINNSTETCPISRCYETGQDVLDAYFVDEGDLAFDLSMLCVLAIVMRLLAYIFLKIRAKRA